SGSGSAHEPDPAPPPGPRRLYRSRDNQVIAGVCGGIGEYLGIDAVLLRIGFVLLVFAGGLGILAYVLAWVFIREEPVDAALPESPIAGPSAGMEPSALVLGLVFVVLGVLFLFDVAWPNFLSWEYLWPLALIALGAAIVFRARR
ncbi:MAG: PspC domain-containing protein, partial [Actinobacteria bacterium]|nr:PspC domain-containing protein [Actinomycetota bacterium]